MKLATKKDKRTDNERKKMKTKKKIVKTYLQESYKDCPKPTGAVPRKENPISNNEQKKITKNKKNC